MLIKKGWLLFQSVYFSKDQDHEDNFVKPEILKRLSSEFSDDLNNNDFVRNQYRDKILSIVKNGTKVKFWYFLGWIFFDLKVLIFLKRDLKLF